MRTSTRLWTESIAVESRIAIVSRRWTKLNDVRQRSVDTKEVSASESESESEGCGLGFDYVRLDVYRAAIADVGWVHLGTIPIPIPIPTPKEARSRQIANHVEGSPRRMQYRC